MSKLQLLVVLFFLMLLGVFYFGFDTKTKLQSEVEQSRALSIESTGIQTLLSNAKSTLNPEQVIKIQAAEKLVKDAASDKAKEIEALKALSGLWYDYKHPAIAGFYAEEVATQVEESDEAWSIAGTTYAIGLKQAKEDKVRSYCMGRAVKSFENAISLDPNNVDHKVNLAICYADSPPQDNPMKGILMLIDLNKKNPDNVGVLTNLGRLGIQTGQFEKAVKRLERAVSLEPENPGPICLLVEAYQGLGKKEEAMAFQKKCQSFANN